MPIAKMRLIFDKLIKQHGSSRLGDIMTAYDGRANLYAAAVLPFEGETTFEVPVDDRDTYVVVLRKVAEKRLQALADFFEQRSTMNAYECVSALDIVLRANPSRTLVAVGSSLYSDRDKGELSNGAEIWMGYYQSLRATQAGMVVNMDMSAAAFIKAAPVVEFLMHLLNMRDERQLGQGLRREESKQVEAALKNAKVSVTHRPGGRQYRVSGISRLSATEQTFPLEDGSVSSVADYFRKQYNIRLKYAGLPLLKVGPRNKNCFLPMEVCDVVGGQRVGKMDPKQTADMIKYTCTRPQNRRGAVHEQLKGVMNDMNKTSEKFGLAVTENQIELTGRVLPAPTLEYSPSGRNKTITPSSGTWNMRDIQFKDPKNLKCWAIVSFCSRRDFNDQAMARLASSLANCARLCGMGTTMQDPPTMYADDFRGASIGKILREACDEASKKAGGEPCQIIICAKPTTDSVDYGQIKQASDTQLGIPTQCLLLKHLHQCKIQYMANVCLKINAKLGGINCSTQEALPFVSDAPTIIFGADVNHPRVGDDLKPSLAAVVASMDRWACKHSAAVRVQGHRVEVIAELAVMVQDLLRQFYSFTGQKPKQILFYRDGVSEGQFRHCLQYEVRAIEEACDKLEPGYRPKITFVVCQKRHHTKLFAPNPQDQDRSGNLLAGTVVDTGVCHPGEFDFYLNSHAGLQGTSRPAHYHVLWDENKFTADALQELTYKLCYLYCRCTRSVSIVPAVYYAHLVAFRAQHFLHEDDSDTSTTMSGKSGRTPADIDWASMFDAVHPNCIKVSCLV
ncbi:unnamed protein product [Chrysoparadoxa australica]